MLSVLFAQVDSTAPRKLQRTIMGVPGLDASTLPKNILLKTSIMCALGLRMHLNLGLKALRLLVRMPGTVFLHLRRPKVFELKKQLNIYF